MIVTGENIYVLKHLLDKIDFEMSVSHNFGKAKKKWNKLRKGQNDEKMTVFCTMTFVHIFFLFLCSLNQMLFETVWFCCFHFRWFH